MTKRYDVVVVGAGAAGMMAAATAGKRGRSVLVIEGTDKIGEKIRISGGGRCNFTNINASHLNYISENKHFVKSALARYTQHDFIDMVRKYGISYHEKTLGQLFCDSSSSEIINMLLSECRKYNVDFILSSNISEIKKDGLFYITHSKGSNTCESLIVASGGLSIPKIGATDFGYRLARQFGLNIIATKPALVPLTVTAGDLEFLQSLSGISIDAFASYNKTSFRENILFTHRGLSGPAILQISSYIDNVSSSVIYLNLVPDLNLHEDLSQNRSSKLLISSYIKQYLPNRFVDNLFNAKYVSKRLIECKLTELISIADMLTKFPVKICGTEGYAKAEVTAGGVDTKCISSKTMESSSVSGLFFVGEVVDVTGWLGGYNFQWAWSSGFIAGSYA